MKVERLVIYPIKSCRGIDVAAAAVTETGLAHDRRWMVADVETGQAITQREAPMLATVTVGLVATGLVVSNPTLGALKISPPVAGEGMTITLFNKTTQADVGLPEADAYFSELTQRPCRLVYQGAHRRPVSEKWAAGAVTNLSDGFPILVVNLASLTDLNSRLDVPVPMERFRPNIVIGGAVAWEEDTWDRLTIGAVTLDCVKPCTRCVITTIDQHSGARDGPQPLQALTRFRMIDDLGLKGAIFGQNAVPKVLGSIACGMDAKIGSRRPAPAFRPVPKALP